MEFCRKSAENAYGFFRYNLTDSDIEIYKNLNELRESDAYILKAFSHKFDWYQIALRWDKWNENLIEKLIDDKNFIQQHGFNGLCGNESFLWTEELVEKFQSHIYWRGLSGNKRFKPSINFLRTYKDSWDWEWWFRFNNPDHISWNYKLLVEFSPKVDKYLGSLKNVEWTIVLIDRFTEHLFHDKSKENVRYLTKNMYLSDNKYIVWRSELIEKYFEKLDWYLIAQNNNFPFTEEIIRKASNEINFENLSKNTGVRWSIELIADYSERWNWFFLCKIGSIKWDSELLELFKEKIVWKSISSLEKEWTFSFIKHYHKYLDWDNLSKNSSVFWTTQIVKTFKNKINYWLLSLYGNISMEIISSFQNEWNVTGIYTSGWLKNSDFPSEHYEIFTSGWDNISMNKLITWRDENIKLFWEKINWYYLAYNGKFNFSDEIIKILPKTGKHYTTDLSSNNLKYVYEDVELTDYFIKRNRH